MTAASANRNVNLRGDLPIARDLNPVPVAASTHIYEGTMVALNLSGYLVPASADPSLYVCGIAMAEADNSSGSAGAISCKVRRCIGGMANSSSTGAVTDADLNRFVYAVDDQTVSRTTNGTYPIAGKVVDVDGSTVYLEVGLQDHDANGVTDILIAAGTDLSTTGQYLFVKASSGSIVLASSAGEPALGVLQNAPASGAIGIVRRRGPSRVMASATLAVGDLVATTATSARAKAAVAGTVSSSNVVGSFAMGTALTTGASGSLMTIDVHPSGLVATTAA